ncbi:MAG: helix-turn-helix domain-containing protein [Clostridia bacterium]
MKEISTNKIDLSENLKIIKVKNLNLPMLSHRNFEIMYVYDGLVQLTLEDKSFEIASGECVFIFPNQSHSYLTYDHSNCVIVTFDQHFTSDFYSYIINLEAVSPIFSLKDDIDVLESLSEADDEYLTKSYLYYLIYKFKSKTAFVTKNQKISSFINIVTNFIAENYAGDISLESLADKLGYDYNYLSSLFNIVFKCNFLYLVNEFRISQAEKMLKSGIFTVTEIAFKCGFNSLRSFNRNFLKFNGVSPSEFLKG